MIFTEPAFWLALLQIVGINIVLSGDNAVVIALAARSLPAKQQRQAVLWGSGAAVAMRIVLTIVAVELLRFPYLKLVGAALLLWIGIQLLLPEEEGGHGNDRANSGMGAAIRTILIADLVMSLDNVIAVAAAAKGNMTLLVLGLLISIPMVVFGSTLLMKFMERWPVIITIGAGLLGWVAGEMAISDPAVKAYVDANYAWLHYAAPALGAAIVVGIGKWLAHRSAETETDRPIVDLASAADQHAPPGVTGAGVTGAGVAGAGVAGAGVTGAEVALARATTGSRVLLVADDTPESQAGIARFIEGARTANVRALDLLNVQAPVSRDVSTFVEEAAIKSLHHDEGVKAISGARTLLEQAGIATTVHIGVGDLIHVVIHYAKSLNAGGIYLTETARGPGSSLEESVKHMGSHIAVPVKVL